MIGCGSRHGVRSWRNGGVGEVQEGTVVGSLGDTKRGSSLRDQGLTVHKENYTKEVRVNTKFNYVRVLYFLFFTGVELFVM